MGNKAIPCDGCGRIGYSRQLTDYHCPACQSLLTALYRSEHPDRATAWRLTEADIRAEYADAEQPYRHLPGRLTVERALGGPGYRAGRAKR